MGLCMADSLILQRSYDGMPLTDPKWEFVVFSFAVVRTLHMGLRSIGTSDQEKPETK